MDSASDNNHPDWDVRSYAEYGNNENAQDVLEYLDLQQANMSEDPAPENDQASMSGVWEDPPVFRY